MKTPWLSSCFVLAVPALIVACSGAGGTSLTDYVQPSESAETVDASATSTPTSTSPGTSTSPTVSSTAPPTAVDAGSSASSDGGAGDASTAISCPYTGTPLPTSSFAACGAGAVCAPTALVPTASQADFATCTTGLCVPTKVLAAYGNYLPTTCTSLQGAEGRCLNQVLPSVAPQVSELPHDVCDSDESCVPCFNPLDGTSTGACNTVSCDAPKDPPTLFTSCCYSGSQPAGKCVPPAAAGSAASSLSADVCSGGDVCAPTENLEPGFAPQPCEDDDYDVFFGYTGFCVSNCIANTNGLGRGGCDGAHYCAPCNDPFSGDPTGVPGCGN